MLTISGTLLFVKLCWKGIDAPPFNVNSRVTKEFQGKETPIIVRHGQFIHENLMGVVEKWSRPRVRRSNVGVGLFESSCRGGAVSISHL